MANTSKFIGSTIGLNACNLKASGTQAAPKMTRIEFYESGDDVILQPVSGHTLSNKTGRISISRSDYESLPHSAYDDVDLARAAMKLCGYEA